MGLKNNADGGLFGGIDPGKTGALVFIRGGDGGIHCATNAPVKDGAYCIETMSGMLATHCGDGKKPLLVMLERVHATQMGGKVSNFDFGRGLGIWEALLVAHGITADQVLPKVWQKELWAAADIVHKTHMPNTAENECRCMLDGINCACPPKVKVDTKATSLACAKRLLPGQDFINKGKSGRGKKPNDGIVDAYLIAEYARRAHVGN